MEFPDKSLANEVIVIARNSFQVPIERNKKWR